MSLIVAAMGVVAGANAQAVLYNNLAAADSANVNSNGLYDLDGGGDSFASQSYGSQIGQVVTDAAGVTSITSIEQYYMTESTAVASGMFGGTAKEGVYAEIFNFSGGVVGTLVGCSANYG